MDESVIVSAQKLLEFYLDENHQTSLQNGKILALVIAMSINSTLTTYQLF
jgi:hypothetical protein